MSVDIKVLGLDNAKSILDYITNNIDEESKKALKILAENIINDARSNLQNNTNINTGHLLSTIRILKEDETSIWVGTDVDYAKYIEYGRGPIRPLKEDGWLHWIDKQTGKDVFAKFAKATEPMPFLEPAVIKNTEDFPRVYAEHMNEIL